MTATNMTPWAPVAVRLALAVTPGEDGLLILGSMTLHETLEIDNMKQLRDTAVALGGGACSTEYAPSVVSAIPPEVIALRRVVVTMEAIQYAAGIEVEAAEETDGLKNALLDRRPNTMMGFGDREAHQRQQALEDAILGATQAGMPPDDVVELRRLVLFPYKEGFRRGLSGEPPAMVEPESVQVGSIAVYACPDTDCSLPSKSAIIDKQPLVELVEGLTSVRTTFGPTTPDEK